jgi:hypothetical protein
MRHSAEEGVRPLLSAANAAHPRATEVSMQSHVPISHSPPAPTLFALLAAGQLKTDRNRSPNVHSICGRSLPRAIPWIETGLEIG